MIFFIFQVRAENFNIFIMIQAAKIIGTGMATIGLIGAGVGIGVVFVASIVGVEEFPNDIRYYLANIMIIVT
jgi:hypothetical protein